MAFVYLRKQNETDWIGVEQLSNSKSKRYFTFKSDELEKVTEILKEEGHGYHEEGMLPHFTHLRVKYITYSVVAFLLLVMATVFI